MRTPILYTVIHTKLVNIVVDGNPPPCFLDQRSSKPTINLINVEYNQDKAFEKISRKSNTVIENSFQLAFEIIKKYKFHKFING